MKIAILGAAGRMGQTLIKCSAKIPGCEIAAAVERPDFPSLGAPAGLPGLAYAADWPENAEAVVDFTFHACVPAAIAKAAARRQAYVLGTTGLAPAEQDAVRAAARIIPVVWANNMSLGINLLVELVRRAATLLNADYDVEIVEAHHRMKKDAPSGTAITLAETVANARGDDPKAVIRCGRDGIVGERPRGEIGIHALRGGMVVGDHSVMFIGDEDRLELKHSASSRAPLANGALRAALWLKGRKPGLYSMRDVLGFEQP